MFFILYHILFTKKIYSFFFHRYPQLITDKYDLFRLSLQNFFNFRPTVISKKFTNFNQSMIVTINRLVRSERVFSLIKLFLQRYIIQPNKFIKDSELRSTPTLSNKISKHFSLAENRDHPLYFRYFFRSFCTLVHTYTFFKFFLLNIN